MFSDLGLWFLPLRPRLLNSLLALRSIIVLIPRFFIFSTSPSQASSTLADLTNAQYGWHYKMSQIFMYTGQTYVFKRAFCGHFNWKFSWSPCGKFRELFLKRGYQWFVSQFNIGVNGEKVFSINLIYYFTYGNYFMCIICTQVLGAVLWRDIFQFDVICWEIS